MVPSPFNFILQNQSMDAATLMMLAKTGSLTTNHARPISNKGTVNDIRRRTEASLRKAGFPKYAMLGSGNAITDQSSGSEPLEIEIDIPGLGPGGAAPAAPAAPAPPPEDDKKKSILPGRTQSDASKAVKPNHSPPYNLETPEGKKQLAEYQGYLMDRYGSTEGRAKADEVEADSRGFTKAYKTNREINIKITQFNRDQSAMWKQWANNAIVLYGNDIIDALNQLGKRQAPQASWAIDKISDIVKRFKPTEMQDFSKAMLEIQGKLWEGRPEWKAKLAELQRPELEKLKKKMEDMSWKEDESKGQPLAGLW
jgi:hypothetical protein